MNNRLLHSLRLILATFDILTINFVYICSDFVFRKQLMITPNIQYAYFIFLLNISWLAVTYINNIYLERNIASVRTFSKVSIHSYVLFLLLIVSTLFFFQLFLLSRVFIIVVLSSIFSVMIINRIIYFLINHWSKKHNWEANKVIIIGYSNFSKKLVNYLSEEGFNKQVVGFCEELENVHELSNYPILSNISDAVQVCKKYGATEIYSTVSPEQNPNLYSLIKSADDNCIRFKIVPDLDLFFKKQMHIDFVKEIPVISVRKEPLEDLENQVKKRIFDIIVSFFVVVFILSWLIPIVGILIWFESKGAIFFSQLRSGKNNKNFKCLKFRSMKNNNTAHERQATKDDDRITKIGKFLRRTSLDEFPQFINVLRGEMSIVGPRPHMLKHTDEYSRLIGQYMVRQLMKPGITGWAQVNGFRGETNTVSQMQKRVEHDLWYMENWSIFLDLKIMFLTIFNIMKGEKNAF